MKNKLKFARFIRERNYEFKNLTKNHKVLLKLQNAYDVESIGGEPIDDIHDENVLATLTWFEIYRDEETEIFSEEFEITESELNNFIASQVLGDEVICKLHAKKLENIGLKNS